jgi:hypothetical protein
MLIGAAIAYCSFSAMAQTANSFTVVNADNNADIKTLTSSGSIDISVTPNINIRVNASGAGSVSFTDDTNTRTESSVPYAYKGDSGGDYLAWSPAPGTYKITVKPYTGANATGTAGIAKVLTLTITGAVPPRVTYKYDVVQGHDGHPDPDDNLAALAGFIAIKRAVDTPSSRIRLLHFIYGDTTAARKRGMINGGSASDNKGEANYEYFKAFTKPALQSLGFDNFTDVVTDTFDFSGNSLTGMTNGGRLIAEKVRDAIGGTTRIVYSAGGGQNAAAEAIAWLGKQGYSETQIKNHFAVVQHSVWNWNNATESTARSLTGRYTLKIEDQNPYSGKDKPPKTVSATRTSDTFAKAWDVALGNKPSGIPNLSPVRDASDGGSHHFSSNASALDANWNNRSTDVGNSSNEIPYKIYNTMLMNSQLN